MPIISSRASRYNRKTARKSHSTSGTRSPTSPASRAMKPRERTGQVSTRGAPLPSAPCHAEQCRKRTAKRAREIRPESCNRIPDDRDHHGVLRRSVASQRWRWRLTDPQVIVNTGHPQSPASSNSLAIGG